MKPRVAVISFPGLNCEVESLRAIKDSGMEAVFFRWNEDREALKDIDGYFIPGGFSYEDRGRAGMVAARDSLMAFLHEEAEKGKVIIGNCNGAQILIESGLVPLGKHLDMSLARNVINGSAVGFLSRWVWITPTCKRDRCATSDWGGVMHLPIAHGEGRFVTKDKDLIAELKANDQFAFSYCDAEGNVSDNPEFAPNGALQSAAGICNPAGNVIALMPHPERTQNGAPYFRSMKQWMEMKHSGMKILQHSSIERPQPKVFMPRGTEIFIDTVIINNEERTIEQTAKKILPSIRIKQLKYVSFSGEASDLLRHLSFFNPSKEIAYVRKSGTVSKWDTATKKEVPLDRNPLEGMSIVRTDEPDTGAQALGAGAKTGVCYVLQGVTENEMRNTALLDIFGNAHASNLGFPKP